MLVFVGVECVVRCEVWSVLCKDVLGVVTVLETGSSGVSGSPSTWRGEGRFHVICFSGHAQSAQPSFISVCFVIVVAKGKREKREMCFISFSPACAAYEEAIRGAAVVLRDLEANPLINEQ
ncbi:unnamed protein product [Ixodes persulcatus]